MGFLILTKKEANTDEFIEYWSSFYSNEKNEEKYTKNINKKSLNSEELLALYEWKNGSILSGNKKKSFDNKILSKLKIINSLKKSFDLDLFCKEFKKLSVIWKIFLLHIINPEYPIYDQHVFRAMRYLSDSSIAEIPASEEEKEKSYFGEYLDFFKKIKKDLPATINNKMIDEALWVFGKFLKSDYKFMLK